MTELRIAILCSFNLDLIGRSLTKALQGYGLEAKLYLSGYAQWETEIADPQSQLFRFEPTTTIVYVDAEDLLPSLSADPRPTTLLDASSAGLAAWQRIERSLAMLVARSHGTVCCHTLAAPSKTSLGLLEGNGAYSHTAAIEEFNRSLRNYASSTPKVHVFDYDGLVREHGWTRWHDHRLWHVGRMRLANASLPLLAQAYARFFAALYTPRRKCLVLDLDNTLWGGVIGEEGLGGIDLGHSGVGLAYREFQMAILALQRRGVILAVASKNNPDDALAAIKTHPDMVLRLEHFAALEIHWQDKSQSLKRIAERLNIGLDSIVFWDDNPMERGMVRDQVPDVLVPEVPTDPSDYASFLLDLACFDTLSLTPEDQRRGQMYREQAERDSFLEESARGARGAELDAYYSSLEMIVEIAVADDFSIPRIAQLTQRTNQFNLTTRRYSDADVRARCNDRTWRVYTLSLRDRFGDLGLIGAAMLQSAPEAWELDTFLMSCRALGRRVEEAFAGYLVRVAMAEGKPLRGVFVSTKKTAPIREMLERHGWLREPIPGGSELRVELTPLEIPSWLHVRVPEDP
jgi:FkbH-like protein